MNLIHGVGDFFALDVGTNSIRLVQLSGDVQRGWNLQHFAYVPVDPKIIQDDSEVGKKQMGEIILGAMKQAGITTKSIAVGMPANKTYTAIIDVPKQDPKEMTKTLKYQLDKYIPMAIDEAKADYVILGDSPNDPNQTEVLISSTSIANAEKQMEMLENLELNVVAQEPEPLAMARALMPVVAQDAHLIIDLGEKSCDIVMMYLGAPRLVRSIPGGFSMLVKTVAATLSVNEDQARQYILKFGLAQDKIEGQVFKALDSVLENFASELVKSIQFFSGKYTNAPVGGIVLSGFAGAVPFMAEYIEAKTTVSTKLGNPWQLVKATPEQQQALQPVVNEFAVVIGLAERSNENV